MDIYEDGIEIIGYFNNDTIPEDEICLKKLGGGNHSDGSKPYTDPKTEPEYICQLCKNWVKSDLLFLHLSKEHNISSNTVEHIKDLDIANYYDVLLPNGRKLPIKEYLNEK